MSRYAPSQLSDEALLRDLATLVARDRATTAQLLAHLAEVDARKLYLPAGYPSMFAYCVGDLRFSEDAAFKRIKAARAARRFPALLEAIAEGRMHLSGVVLLAPHLTQNTADELLAAATHQSKSEIERLLAERFPRTDVLAWVEAIPASLASRPAGQQAPGPVEDQLAPGRAGEDLQLVAERVGEALKQAPGPVGDRSRVKPLSPQSFAIQFTLGRSGHEKLRYAQDLLGHQIPCGDLAAVFERALDALIPELERSKFAATAKPMTGRPRATGSTRHIPAHVRRAVWERDGGQCTFASETGRRCPARTRLETLWNDGLAVVTSSCLREEKPTAVARGHRDRGLAPVAPEPHTKGARREHEQYHLRWDGRTQEGDQRGDAAAGAQPAGRVAAGQRAGRDSAAGEEARARGAG